MKEAYAEYFGEPAPSNFERLLYLAEQEIKIYVLNPPLVMVEEEITDYGKALLEQVKYFELNNDLLDSAGSGFSLGKYREGNSNVMASDNRLSPMTYKILLNLGLLYSGIDGGCYV